MRCRKDGCGGRFKCCKRKVDKPLSEQSESLQDVDEPNIEQYIEESYKVQAVKRV